MIMWIRSGDFEKEISLLINQMILLKHELLLKNSWIPFPESACSFTFGKDSKTLPIGALFLLWDNFEEFRGTCNNCNDNSIYGYGFYWYLSHAAIAGCCTKCNSQCINRIDGRVIKNDLTLLFKDTPFYLNKWGFLGSTYKASRTELIEALKKLGVTNLPDEKWINKIEKQIREIKFK